MACCKNRRREEERVMQETLGRPWYRNRRRTRMDRMTEQAPEKLAKRLALKGHEFIRAVKVARNESGFSSWGMGFELLPF
jgi:hypothetical protein